jgi:hypothetical protein
MGKIAKGPKKSQPAATAAATGAWHVDGTGGRCADGRALTEPMIRARAASNAWTPVRRAKSDAPRTTTAEKAALKLDEHAAAGQVPNWDDRGTDQAAPAQPWRTRDKGVDKAEQDLAKLLDDAVAALYHLRGEYRRVESVPSDEFKALAYHVTSYLEALKSRGNGPTGMGTPPDLDRLEAIADLAHQGMTNGAIAESIGGERDTDLAIAIDLGFKEPSPRYPDHTDSEHDDRVKKCLDRWIKGLDDHGTSSFEASRRAAENSVKKARPRANKAIEDGRIPDPAVWSARVAGRSKAPSYCTCHLKDCTKSHRDPPRLV